ncbi:MAG: peptidoglycan-binding protein [Roseinatronobacter sp.]|jgi:hypothetical protein|nr:peptidoglycan-binding protein [Roseinatronobacter sp.]
MKQGYSRAGMGIGRAAFTVALALCASPLMAETVAASRAKVEMVNLSLPPAGGRDCWARYSRTPPQPRGEIEEVAFRVPCPEQMTPRFIETLQRALSARGHYDGPITGRTDPATRAAVQQFQRAQGFNSPILTLETAQRLGLLPIEISRN